MEEEQNKLQDRNICSVAKQVTSRLYKAPEPKFKYVPKVKEKDITPIPKAKNMRDRNSELKSRTSPVNALRDFDRSKSESPHRVTGKRNSPSPARTVVPKKRSASAPHMDQILKEGSKPKDGYKNKGDKHIKEDSKVINARNKDQGPHRILSKTSGLGDKVSPTSRLGGVVSSNTRVGATVSPEKLALNPVRTSTPGGRQMSSASSLASVPESLIEHEDASMNENHKEQDIANYVVKKRQKKGRASFLDDNFRCHSAPDSQVMSSALDEYTVQMNTELQHGLSNSNQVVPVLTASVSVDGSVLYREKEMVSNTDDGANLEAENELVGIDSEIQMIENTNIDQIHTGSEIELSALNEKAVHMYISSGEESKSIDDLDEIQGDEDSVDMENAKDSIKSVEDWTVDVNESLTDNSMETTGESNISEDTEVIVLRKRELTDSDKIKDIDVPNKKPKPIIDHGNETENVAGINSDESQQVHQKSVIEMNDNENFSEDSLDISIDSLDNEKHITRLTQSLPAYLIWPEKPMSDDSLSDSFDEQNKYAKDSLETDQTDKNEVGAISAVDGVLGTVVMEISNQSSVSNVKFVNSGIGCHDNTAMASLPVLNKPKLTLVSLEPINFIPSEGLRNVHTCQDETLEAQCEITCLLDHSEETSLTPINEDLSNPTSQVVETSSKENSELCITPFDSPEYSGLKTVALRNVGTLDADTEHSDMNQTPDENEADKEQCAIKESVTKYSEFDYVDIKGDSSGEHQDHAQLVAACRNNDVDHVPLADNMNEVRSYVTDILNQAQDIYIESFECKDGRSIEENIPGIQAQINNSANKSDIYSANMLKHSLEKEPAHSCKEVINTTEELGMDNVNNSDSQMFVRLHNHLDTDLVAVNIQNETIQNDDSIDSSAPHQSEKDNTTNRTSQQKHIDKTVDSSGHGLEVDIICDQSVVATRINNDVLEIMDHITHEIGENVAAAYLHNEIDEMETGPTTIGSANNTYFMERNENDYSSDGQISDNSVNEKIQKDATVVDENHNVIAMAAQEEDEAGNDNESVEADLTDEPQNMTDESIPTFQTSDNIDSQGNDIDTENDFSKKAEYETKSNPIIKGLSNEVTKTTFETDNACELNEDTEQVDTQQTPSIIADHTVDIQQSPEVPPEHMDLAVDTQPTPDIILADSTVDTEPTPKITVEDTQGIPEVTLEDDTVDMPQTPEVTLQDKTRDTQPTSKLSIDNNTVDTPQAHEVTSEDNTFDTQETTKVIPEDNTVTTQKTHEVTVEKNPLDIPQTPEVIPEDNTVDTPQTSEVNPEDTVDTPQAQEVSPEDNTVDTSQTPNVTLEHMALAGGTTVTPERTPEVTEHAQHILITPKVSELAEDELTPKVITISKTITAERIPENTELTEYTPITPGLTPDDTEVAEGRPITHELFPKGTTIAISLEHEVTPQNAHMLRDSADSIADKSSINKDATENADTADRTTAASSSLVLTRTVGVGTSQDLLDQLDDIVMGDNCSQGSNDSFLLDPRQELQVLQEALEKLPAKYV